MSYNQEAQYNSSEVSWLPRRRGSIEDRGFVSRVTKSSSLLAKVQISDPALNILKDSQVSLRYLLPQALLPEPSPSISYFIQSLPQSTATCYEVSTRFPVRI